ncbi:hypothetical protein [Zestomonas carbonaria]|uniref:Phage baseplate protein n=1 Tax=Zestomonas carbonaria TaxID=2762745 RepID=A0A7U7ENY0_9GAMM|nr:hypothetical protein [Pseudomonas carbonaria]CAD5108376.1 hypothetical protein PSEWESI4_02661 [Pseudomonas carbonaria]
MSALTAADWLQAWEHSQGLPPPLRPCALLAPLLEGGAEAAERLPLGRRDSQLLALHGALFGPRLSATADCPACGERLELALDCHALRLDAPEPDPQAQAVAWQGRTFHYRLPDSRDLAAMARAGDLDQARALLLRRCLGSDWADDLPADLQAELARAMAEADPQAATELALSCPACGEQWSELFDIGAYLDEAFGQWAERLFDQVHLLASAYGWSEAQILALGPARRARYLARVLA